MKRRNASVAILCAAVALAGCARDNGATTLLGTLEWDRIAVPAEVSEPITQILVKESDHVAADQALVQLDPRRTQAQVDAAQADTQRLSAALDELRHGARIETIDASRAALARAQAGAANAQVARDRTAAIRAKGLNSQADLDNANATLRTANADVNAARANLDELLHGTRIEDLEQGEASLAQAQATLAQLQVTLQRLSVRAPRAGRVDALPFKLGDRPAAGASVVSLLVGDAPYARVYVPEPQRREHQPGRTLQRPRRRPCAAARGDGRAHCERTDIHAVLRVVWRRREPSRVARGTRTRCRCGHRQSAGGSALSGDMVEPFLPRVKNADADDTDGRALSRTRVAMISPSLLRPRWLSAGGYPLSGDGAARFCGGGKSADTDDTDR